MTKPHLLSGPRAAVLLAAGVTALLVSCNVMDRDLGKEPVGPKHRPFGKGLDSLAGGWVRDSVASNMRIFATPQKLKAGNKDKAKINVQVFDASHNPLSGVVVRFATSLGTITASDTTDGEGMAQAAYAPVPRNGEVRVLAGAALGDSMVFVGTALQLAGLSVRISPLSKDTLLDKVVPLAVSVLDGDGEPVASAAVTLSGAKDKAGITDGAGVFASSVVSDKEGTVKITAAALGAADSVTVGFWQTAPDTRFRTLLLFADPPRIAAVNGETSRIKAILYDDKHNPVGGKVIAFTASHGIITPTDTTGPDGVADAVFQGLAQNADVAVTASYPNGDSLRRATTTVSLAGLRVEVKPSASEVLIGDTVPVTVRVRDAAGRPMSDVQVLLKGALQSSIRTNASGVAGISAVSASERALLVSASALGGADSAKIVFLRTLPGDSISRKVSVGNLRIFVDHSRLKASNTDSTLVRVVAFDKFNNPLAGRPVRFTANQGIITAFDSTDARGEATAVYRSVPLNTDARLTASMSVDDSVLAVATTVTLSGVVIDVLPSLTDALVNRQVPVNIRLADGAGNPITDATILYNGNPGVGTTNGDGIFKTSITSGSQKRMTVSAKALGAEDSANVDFWTVLPVKNGNDVSTIRKMRIFSSRSQLRADNSDFSVITVILTNENNNPAVGEVVRFTSDLGIIGQSASVDTGGRAVVVLRSAPVNGICKVQATAVGRNLTASTQIAFSGVSLQLVPDRTELKTSETASLEAFLKDASGNPIGGDEVLFSLGGAGTFDNGNTTYTAVLNPNGRALVRVGSGSAGNVTVRASSLNTSDSLVLRFSNNSLTLAVASPVLAVGGNDSTSVTATYVDGSNNAVANARIIFAANAGRITRDTVLTDAQGKASTFLKSATFAGTAIVQANAPGGAAQIQVAFSSTQPKVIKLSVTADNISVNGGVASLKATVTDAEGNMVSGQSVNFRILKGPGGGESITKPVVQTQSGVALSQLQAGGLASGYRGTVVVATVAGLSDTSKLTISGTAQIVTVSRPEDDSIPVGNGGFMDETTFEFFLGAVVQDINGNAVADGTEVHFSAVVTGLGVYRRILDKWAGLGSLDEVKPIYKLVVRDFPFEDINNNLKFDAGVDLDLDRNDAVLRRGEDRNGDGVMDWKAASFDTWFDLNGNGLCEPGVGENDTVVVEGKTLFADLNANGVRDYSEIMVKGGSSGPGVCDLPASGDYPYAAWEVRNFLSGITFTDNEFAVAIEVSAVTKSGVAHARLRYPRQFANRLFVNVNAEANGIRDKDGERFLLPRIVGK